jgi:hypothetical protein
MIPGSPFAYYAPDSIRGLFATGIIFESKDRTARGGAKTLDDFRFLRLWWEVPPALVGRKRHWTHFSKGGVFALYYTDVHLVIDWEDEGRRLREFYQARSAEESWGGFARSEAFYYRPGVTWARRTTRGSFRCLPADCIFSEQGCAAFVEGDNDKELFQLLAIMNSAAFRSLVRLQTGSTSVAQHFLVGVIRQTPFPTGASPELAALATEAVRLQQTCDTYDETTAIFYLPAIARALTSLSTISHATNEVSRVLDGNKRTLIEIQTQVDQMTWKNYGIDPAIGKKLEDLTATSVTTLSLRPPIQAKWTTLRKESFPKRRLLANFVSGSLG